jgi:hypothetical protein
MNDVFVLELIISCNNLLHKLNGLALRKRLLDTLAEVGMAKLSDQVGVIFGRVDVMEGEDVGKVF